MNRRRLRAFGTISVEPSRWVTADKTTIYQSRLVARVDTRTRGEIVEAYSDKVIDHFLHPRNVGVIKDPDGVGEIGNPVCGDIMKLYIKVKDGRIKDAKFQTFGCGAAIATSSIITEMVVGKTLDEAKAVTSIAVAEALRGLPARKLHCSNLAADALHKAIADYEQKAGKQSG